ncbi:hypothetical protein RB2654_15440 [Rhodobacterales bacterium HTCC2654]|uniref:Uncharacterized protein n=1 Tax=Maritimibacter alkaliphilus HTCC2654 TaxID=314271 RepID=A3VHD7_9RHOB|nr:hypothetical protein RB2654_15440 [Rhodobacterales bacterium HTCC2654] [Maritimibacter alkaliphilus HTCC2654]
MRPTRPGRGGQPPRAPPGYFETGNT